jgi:aspartyl-tRNA(Asn)/glutamyl-tRNA(Gln) amidotransferase subunit A
MISPSAYGSIHEISDQIRARTESPVTIVAACLQRIEQLNPELNAFATVLADESLEEARHAEAEINAGRWLGVLHGIPIGIKDFYDTAGVRTTAATRQFLNRIPSSDAELVARLKRAGAIIIGKTNMHELGMGTTSLVSVFGPVHNPLNPDYIAGGSSGGSAVAVAMGMCYATIDTDAIGSCRLPAACCGVVGYKGTYGLLSARGILEGEPADPAILLLAHPAITTRSANDTAILVKALADRETRTILEPRVGVVTNIKPTQSVRVAFEAAVERLRTLGYQLRQAAAPFDNPGFDVRNIVADRAAIAARSFRDVDVLVLPTTNGSIPTVKQAEGNPLALAAENTMFANYFGLPAISVPSGLDARGLPLALQIVGRPWEDGTVLELANTFLTRRM